MRLRHHRGSYITAPVASLRSYLCTAFVTKADQRWVCPSLWYPPLFCSPVLFSCGRLSLGPLLRPLPGAVTPLTMRNCAPLPLALLSAAMVLWGAPSSRLLGPIELVHGVAWAPARALVGSAVGAISLLCVSRADEDRQWVRALLLRCGTSMNGAGERRPLWALARLS